MDKSMPVNFRKPTIDEQNSAPITPWHMPFGSWKAITLRAVKETMDDNIGLIAAGVSFYGFLAIVPLLGALVLSYGLIAEPQTVVKNMRTLMHLMPADAAKLVSDQLIAIVKTSAEKKGIGLFLAITLALFGARNGAGSIIIALNIAYEAKERRGFVRVNFLAFLITVCSVIFVLVAALAIALLTRVEAVLPELPSALLISGRVLAYVAVLLIGAAGAGTLYRYAPSRPKARWLWISPGSLLAGTLWLGLTLGFGIYVASFGSYNATYGSLGAIAILLTWLYLSSYALLFGAELNSEFEREKSYCTKAAVQRQANLADATVETHGATKMAGESNSDVGKRKHSSKHSLTPSPLFDAGLVLMAFGIAWLGRNNRRPDG